MMRVPRNAAFSLLEVVVALAMLALIAVPAIGLAAMVVNQSREQMSVSFATEIKAKVDVALRAQGSAVVFDADFLPATIWASKDLSYIELAEPDGTPSTENLRYYRVDMRAPEGYAFQASDSYRIILYELTWPHEEEGKTNLSQAFFSSVFRK